MLSKCALAAAGLAVFAAPAAIRVLRAAAPALKFEVASVRPCEPGHGPPGFGINPGRFTVRCLSVRSLIGTAYVTNAEAGSAGTFARDALSGGPAWLNSVAYDIEAKAEGNAAGSVMAGPMLRALLEERFQLKLHREMREIPVYALSVAKSGFKLKALAEESCTLFDPFSAEPQGLSPDEARAAAAQRCNWSTGFNYHVDVHAATLDQMAARLGSLRVIDRPVVNRTGIAGIFDFHFAYSPDETTGRAGFVGDPGAEPAAAAASAGPSIFSALQEQLGLRLEAATGPAQFLVIDRIERPSEN